MVGNCIIYDCACSAASCFSYVPFAKMFEFSLYKMNLTTAKTIHMWDLKIILMYLQEMTVLTH